MDLMNQKKKTLGIESWSDSTIDLEILEAEGGLEAVGKYIAGALLAGAGAYAGYKLYQYFTKKKLPSEKKETEKQKKEISKLEEKNKSIQKEVPAAKQVANQIKQLSNSNLVFGDYPNVPYLDTKIIIDMEVSKQIAEKMDKGLSSLTDLETLIERALKSPESIKNIDVKSLIQPIVNDIRNMIKTAPKKKIRLIEFPELDAYLKDMNAGMRVLLSSAKDVVELKEKMLQLGAEGLEMMKQTIQKEMDNEKDAKMKQVKLVVLDEYFKMTNEVLKMLSEAAEEITLGGYYLIQSLKSCGAGKKYGIESKSLAELDYLLSL